MLFALLFTCIFLLHAPLLRLPYFWDEAGYFIPAARDVLLHGTLIPQSTLSNAHPPLVMAYLAGWWKLSGYTPAVTRTAMLLVAAFALLGLFRLARLSAHGEVAVATTLCAALYPVFFAQSSLAHLDVAAAGLTFWALSSYLRQRRPAAVVWFSLALLAKETAIITPLALVAWEMLCPCWQRKRGDQETICIASPAPIGHSAFLLLSLLPLAAWFGYHYARTGYVFGNPEFLRYNFESTLSFPRILLAGAQRIWQVAAYMNLFVLTLAAAAALRLPPLRDGAEDRPRIPLRLQAVFAVVIVAHIAVLALIGGAVLARYMLPAVPLVILLCVSTLRRRLRWWPAVIVIACLGFVVGLLVNPPYGFAPEDNLAYRDYILLHRAGDQFVAEHYGKARVLTAWPASDELTSPSLGYVKRPLAVVPVPDFSLDHVIGAASVKANFDVALLFSTKYQPAHDLLGWLPAWERAKTRFFGYHRDLPPDSAAQLLGGQIVFQQRRAGQWIAVVAKP